MTHVKPRIVRLQIALECGLRNMERSGWLFDSRVFRCSPEHGNLEIGNLLGFMASIGSLNRTGLALQPMTAGIAVLQTARIKSFLADPTIIPEWVRPDAHWQVDTVCYRDFDRETFGWHAACEFFGLGMWDAKRIFQGYGSPQTPTLTSTLDFLERFIANHQ